MVKLASTQCNLVNKRRRRRRGKKKKKTGGDSAPIDTFLSAMSVLVVVQLSSEVPEGLMNNPVYIYNQFCEGMEIWTQQEIFC
jgi:hypothetical protein